MSHRSVGRQGHAHAPASLLFVLGVCGLCEAAGAPRVTGLYRGGDLLDAVRFEYCADISGVRAEDLRLMLDGRLLDLRTGHAGQLRFEIDRRKYASGPFWLEQAGGRSNSVWLSVQDSAIVAASAADVAKNPDGINTYVDLVSIIVEEAFEAVPEATGSPRNTMRASSAPSRRCVSISSGYPYRISCTATPWSCASAARRAWTPS